MSKDNNPVNSLLAAILDDVFEKQTQQQTTGTSDIPDPDIKFQQANVQEDPSYEEFEQFMDHLFGQYDDDDGDGDDYDDFYDDGDPKPSRITINVLIENINIGKN